MGGGSSKQTEVITKEIVVYVEPELEKELSAMKQEVSKLDPVINPFALIDVCTRPKQATSFKKSYKKNYRSYKLSEHTMYQWMRKGISGLLTKFYVLAR